MSKRPEIDSHKDNHRPSLMIAVAHDSAATGPRIALPAIIGIAVVAVFFGVFVTWAALAPLESAAIAPGRIIFDTNRKTVQHLEGGIVGEILVRDGDHVEAGQVLARLDDTQPRANLQVLRVRWLVDSALRARLRAERDRLEAIEFPDWLVKAASDGKLDNLIQDQINIFQARRESIESQTAILKQRIEQFSEEITGLNGEIKAQDTRLALIGEEVGDLTILFEKRLVPKSRLLELRRRAAAIEGERSRNVSDIARAKQSISESYLKITELETTMLTEVVQDLRDTEAELFDLFERIRAAEDVIARTEIRAPLDGTIVNLRIHSPRGVISPGEPLLDIVPEKDHLVVEALVNPIDIDVVHAGLPAHVRLTSFNNRSVTPIDGKVTSVSADSLENERTGERYYLARVALTGDVTEALEGGQLYPGMPAEVMIATGARTALEYVVWPITRNLDRAFRQQ